ncbi:MAG: hypothetical protein GF405_00765 [Candidatus Eisenbacteria bacterium]|nr:hypothetical protein [Candidatus Eisenbacteria bacterium]
MTSRRNIAVLALSVLFLTSPAGDGSGGADASAVPSVPADTASPGPQRAPTDSTAIDSLRAVPDRVDVLYFHRTARCENCVRFEEYTAGVLADSLSPELERGTVTWRTVNLDDEGEEGLVERYDILESSLVLSVLEDGEEVAWSKLDGIWVFVEDEALFRRYVLGEMLNAIDAVRRTQ